MKCISDVLLHRGALDHVQPYWALAMDASYGSPRPSRDRWHSVMLGSARQSDSPEGLVVDPELEDLERPGSPVREPACLGAHVGGGTA